MSKYWKFFSIAVVLMYFFLGFYLLLSPRFESLTREIKVISFSVRRLAPGKDLREEQGAERRRVAGFRKPVIIPPFIFPIII
jgi:hypothetical protein